MVCYCHPCDLWHIIHGSQSGAPSVMMRKGFEPKPGSWSSNSGDKILGDQRWSSTALIAAFTPFHCQQKLQPVNSRTMWGAIDGATIQPWCINDAISDWCHGSSCFHLVPTKKKCQKPPLGRSLLQPGLCFSCDSNFLASTFHRTNSCASGASSGVYHLIPEWYDCNHGES